MLTAHRKGQLSEMYKETFGPALRTMLLKRSVAFSCVSLAGIFLLLRGKADVHIAPDFPDKPFKSMEEGISTMTRHQNKQSMKAGSQQRRRFIE
ncbi:hypothetical protein ANCDUO_14297 [Ancylostoma duodenale]|uniref:DUF1907 domain-containing protein n=1 Tax=Ancylostoma duodenale TaxID=51022 RepID=A0A0C2G9J1_9BILA|nr:hypothetical protein ANCDUO_14297 [Ancylostoma duodenale]